MATLTITGPLGVNLDGAGGNVLTTDQWIIGGKLYMIKVTPAHGVSYYLIDEKGEKQGEMPLEALKRRVSEAQAAQRPVDVREAGDAPDDHRDADLVERRVEVEIEQIGRAHV